MSVDRRLRGERPANAIEYQQPTHDELYAEIRRLDHQLQEACNLLDNARSIFRDPDLKRSWARRRRAVRETTS